MARKVREIILSLTQLNLVKWGGNIPLKTNDLIDLFLNIPQ